MTRILYWNIENFSLNKIFNNFNGLAFGLSLDRQFHILHEVMGQNVPDIFVIVEVYSRIKEVGLEGTVLKANGNAGKGVLLLHDRIRKVYGNEWCLVPPLNLGCEGYREAVAVFYNSEKLQFDGPYIWCQEPPIRPGAIATDWSQPIHEHTINNRTNYPCQWQNVMPNPHHPNPNLKLNRGRRVDMGGVVHSVPEWQFAGQWQYYKNETPVPSPIVAGDIPNRIYFPGRDNRSPFLTQFIDLTNGANNRIIKLFAVHTSPDTAAQAVRKLANVQEIQDINANDVSVIVGDFNVDTFNMDQNGAYAGLLVPPCDYTMALDPRDGDHVNPDRHPYCLTHLLPTDQATPFNANGVWTDAQHNEYPRYGYMGSMGGENFEVPVNTGAIDNVFTRNIPSKRPRKDQEEEEVAEAGTGADGGGQEIEADGAMAGGPAPNISIVNTVTGKPYNAIPDPNRVIAELREGLAYNSTLDQELINQLQNGGFDPPQVGDPGGAREAKGDIPEEEEEERQKAFAAFENFRAWRNFGRIRSTSDHLALIIEV